MISQLSTLKPSTHPIASRRATASQSTTSLVAHQSLIKDALSSWVDGVMILSTHGHVIHCNAAAQHMCDRLLAQEHRVPSTYRFTSASAPMPLSSLPQELGQLCKPLIKGGQLDPGLTALETELNFENNLCIRVRVTRLDLDVHQSHVHQSQENTPSTQPYLLIILEDRYQSIRTLAATEIQHYGLTPRQADVWRLHRLGYSRQAIAQELFIALDTVKKHLRESRIKQRLVDL